MRGQLRGHLFQQPPLLHDPVDQIGPHLGEAQLSHAGGDALLGVPPPLRCQPLGAGRQPHPRPRQRRLHRPVAYPKLRSDPGDTGAGIAAGLQIPAEIRLFMIEGVVGI